MVTTRDQSMVKVWVKLWSKYYGQSIVSGQGSSQKHNQQSRSKAQKSGVVKDESLMILLGRGTPSNPPMNNISAFIGTFSITTRLPQAAIQHVVMGVTCKSGWKSVQLSTALQ